MKNVVIGQKVVRSIGDYVVGRVGLVVSIDSEKNRAQVKWSGDPTTWVAIGSIEPESDPYEIVRSDVRNKKTGLRPHPKYRKV